VIEEGAKVQPRMMAQSRTIDEGMRKRWAEVGGEFVRFSPDEQARVRQLLGPIGDEVTKDNAAVSAFYKQLLATAQKN